jgi:hypothetical protein
MKIELEILDSKVDFILDWLKQYSYVKIRSLKKEKKENAPITDIVVPKETGMKPNKMQELLLQGPVMTEKEYRDFLAKRKHFSTWK